MRIWLRRLVLPLLMLTPCALQELNAQTTTSGALSGVVTDQSSAVMPDANVEIRDDAKGTTQSTTTDRTGVYQFPFLLPAEYKVTISHPGFQEERRLVTIQGVPAITNNITRQIGKTSN